MRQRRASVRKAQRRAAAGVLGVLACLALTLALTAPSALASEACANEQQRSESNIDPTTGKAYSLGLPECSGV